MENQRTKKESRKFKNISTMMFYKNLPFFSILCLMGMIYIANVHYAEQNLIRSQKLREELRAVQWDFRTLQSKIIYQSTEGQISKKVVDKDLQVRADAAKIIIKKEN